MARPTLATLSIQNLKHNVRTIRQHIGFAKIIAMLKANAYGHGIRSTARHLQDDVDVLGVASIDEAMALRKAGITSPILLMEGMFCATELSCVLAEKFQIVLHSAHQVQWIEHLTTPLTLWIKVNTGMNRLGFPDAVAAQIAHQLYKKGHFIGLMSHFASADSPDVPQNHQQIQRFNDLSQQVPHHAKSFCNSAGLFAFPSCHHDYVRPGLALYGISPFAAPVTSSLVSDNSVPTNLSELNLRPVMTLQSRIIALEDKKSGEVIGYTGRYVCPRDMRVGVIAVGYGDGYPVSARDTTPVLVHGVRCPLVGRVSMDMLTIDLTPCPKAALDSPVTLWGEGLPVEEIAPYTQEHAWSLVCGIQNRVKCVWV